MHCHFFDDSVIEFDLHPREVAGQAQLDALIDFMQSLSAANDKPALMTPENTANVAFLIAQPSGEIEYRSSECFSEEIAPLR